MFAFRQFVEKIFTNGRERMRVVSVDLQKAFDSVSREMTTSGWCRRGVIGRHKNWNVRAF